MQDRSTGYFENINILAVMHCNLYAPESFLHLLGFAVSVVCKLANGTSAKYDYHFSRQYQEMSSLLNHYKRFMPQYKKYINFFSIICFLTYFRLPRMGCSQTFQSNNCSFLRGCPYSSERLLRDDIIFVTSQSGLRINRVLLWIWVSCQSVCITVLDQHQK